MAWGQCGRSSRLLRLCLVLSIRLSGHGLVVVEIISRSCCRLLRGRLNRLGWLRRHCLRCLLCWLRRRLLLVLLVLLLWGRCLLLRLLRLLRDGKLRGTRGVALESCTVIGGSSGRSLSLGVIDVLGRSGDEGAGTAVFDEKLYITRGIDVLEADADALAGFVVGDADG